MKYVPTSVGLGFRSLFFHIKYLGRSSWRFFVLFPELVGIRNALHGLPQEVKKRYFKNELFMTAWIEGVNYLIQLWYTIKEKFAR